MDWTRLSKLRQLYISGQESIQDYWQDSDLLSDYHHSLAQRIGWKWNSVLTRMQQENQFTDLPKVLRIKDWGCGTGIAALSCSRHLLDHNFQISVSFQDRSARAVAFASQQMKDLSEDIKLSNTDEPADLLLISHVLTEMDQEHLGVLQQEMKRSRWILWVEPGTLSVGRRLAEVKDSLRDQFEVLAPCTHQKECPLSSRPNDWCHFFAKAPQEAFQSKFWREFADQLKIDVASLPTSFLFLGPKQRESSSKTRSRLIGSVKKHKAYMECLTCSDQGTQMRRYMKKDKDGFRVLKKPSFAMILEEDVGSH